MATLIDQICTKASLETRRLQFRVQRTPSVLDVERLAQQLNERPNVLFLCTGNICRSPFAERYLRDALRNRSEERMLVDSAGIRTHQGRSSPEQAVSVGTEFGVDLSDHRSKPVTEAQLEWSDIVFVMDLHNDHYLRRKFGRQPGTYFLGALTPDDAVEIADPYGGGESTFRSLYSEIVSAIDEGLALVVEDG
ncbi:low molecular weight protein-tyrosine-phosphatase [Natronomonas sp.]|uniref:low molecular weight protein-tyrosine-phosphatase n=1 Tax=Natronomonas sp. TaxID=2184060 RepID=UPI0039761E64